MQIILLLYFFDLFCVLDAFELALFASSGCYSHDVMMREVGHEFQSMSFPDSTQNRTENAAAISSLHHSPPTRIHWLQIYIYDFGFGQIEKPTQWNSVVLDVAENGDEYTKEFKLLGHKLLWHMNLPFDHSRPWDLRGAYFFFHVLHWNHRFCQQFVKTPMFRKLLQNQKIDFVVVDHFIQECFTAAASLLNATTIQFSNWPIADGYIVPMNVPAPPSAYPKTATTFSPKDMRHFLVRLRNTLWHCVIIGVRALLAHLVNGFFASIGHDQVDLSQLEARHVFYAGRAEFLAEPVRPITNRIKFFGCATCRSPEEYRILSPVQQNIPLENNQCQKRLLCRHFYKPESSSAIQNDDAPNCTAFCRQMNCSPADGFFQNGTLDSRINCSKSIQMDQMVNNEKMLLERRRQQRYITMRQEFPDIDWTLLEQRKFILVSFGSIAKVEFMPAELLQIFLWAFSRSPHLIIWQTNSNVKKILSSTSNKKEGGANLTLPSNLRFIRWAPIKTLLAHPNIWFTILHGGVNTINEALMFGKPILGLPLQGDQSSNLQRLVDLGMAELVDINGVWSGHLETKMAQLEANYMEYLRRAEMVSAMVNSYRSELGGGQHFWLHWAARRGHSIWIERHHKFFHFRYRNFVEYFALTEFALLLLSGIFLCAFFSRK